MQNCADTNIVDNFCVQCKKKYSFQNNVKRMVHLGYYHKELYKYLRGDASIDLTPFRERQEVKEKTYRCENCETVFQRKVALMSHIKYHCVVTPFPCESCEKTYTTSKDLKVHKMIHGRKKIYQQNISTCDMCWKIFSKKCTLKRHQHLQHLQLRKTTHARFVDKYLTHNMATEFTFYITIWMNHFFATNVIRAFILEHNWHVIRKITKQSYLQYVRYVKRISNEKKALTSTNVWYTFAPKMRHAKEQSYPNTLYVISLRITIGSTTSTHWEK